MTSLKLIPNSESTMADCKNSDSFGSKDLRGVCPGFGDSGCFVPAEVGVRSREIRCDRGKDFGLETVSLVFIVDDRVGREKLFDGACPKDRNVELGVRWSGTIKETCRGDVIENLVDGH